MHEDGMPTLPLNLSTVERVVRIVAGLTLFALGVTGLFAEPAAGAIRLAALVPIATGALGWCPIYLGLNHLGRMRRA